MKHQFSRQDVKTGDILVWDGDSVTGGSSIYLKLVRLLTMSDYGHVSIAWRDASSGQLFHVEATQPYIRRVLIPDNESFYCIRTDRDVSDASMVDFFHDKIGTKYSFLDAVYAYLGKRPKADNRWQCVELANYFCKHIGIDVPDVYIPNEFVQALMLTTGNPLNFVKDQ